MKKKKRKCGNSLEVLKDSRSGPRELASSILASSGKTISITVSHFKKHSDMRGIQGRILRRRNRLRPSLNTWQMQTKPQNMSKPPWLAV